MEQIIDWILEMHRVGVEIDKQVPTCGMGPNYIPQWHICGYEAFADVAKELNSGNYDVIDNGSSPYRFRCEFTYRGVLIFCLTDEEVTK